MEEYEFIYSGGETHDRAIGVLMSKNLSQAITDIALVSEKITWIRIGIKRREITIIQVYALTGEHEDG